MTIRKETKMIKSLVRILSFCIAVLYGASAFAGQLHDYAESGNLFGIQQELIRSGNLIDDQNGDGQTALDVAGSNKVRELLKKHAS
jgi:hypothetical protein